MREIADIDGVGIFGVGESFAPIPPNRIFHVLFPSLSMWQGTIDARHRLSFFAPIFQPQKHPNRQIHESVKKTLDGLSQYAGRGLAVNQGEYWLGGVGREKTPSNASVEAGNRREVR